MSATELTVLRHTSDTSFSPPSPLSCEAPSFPTVYPPNSHPVPSLVGRLQLPSPMSTTSEKNQAVAQRQFFSESSSPDTIPFFDFDEEEAYLNSAGKEDEEPAPSDLDDFETVDGPFESLDPSAIQEPPKDSS